MKITDRINISYSAWSTYKKSPLQFFFQYILKPTPTNVGYPVYGAAGNVVHNAIEQHLISGEDFFDHYWMKYNIDNLRGMRGAVMDKDAYRLMFNNAIEYLTEYSHFTITPEQRIIFDFYGCTFKGIVDIVINAVESIFFFDWKTNTTNNYEMHKDQRLFYSWMLWKTQEKIPLCKWVYLRNIKEQPDRFDVDDLALFEKEITKFADDINEKGDDISKYELGNYNNPFNTYYDLCVQEEERKKTKDEILFKIKGNFVFIEGDFDYKLEEGIDYATKFDLPDKFFMQKKVKEKMLASKALQLNKAVEDLTDAEKISAINYEFVEKVGTVQLYNKKFKCFPIGLMSRMQNLVNEYNIHYKTNKKVFINDRRDFDIMKQGIDYGEKLITDNKLRPYQVEAIGHFREKETGILHLPTGSGKTFIAAEIIRQMNAKTLWICDRKELLTQTKNVLENLLGKNIGLVQGDTVDFQDITVATVQSLISPLSPSTRLSKCKNRIITNDFFRHWGVMDIEEPNEEDFEDDTYKIAREQYLKKYRAEQKKHKDNYKYDSEELEFINKQEKQFLEDETNMINALYKFNFVIIDEFHKAAAESFQKVFAKLPNTCYRLGLTATIKRDDGKTPILHSVLGDVIYYISTKELEEQGYLVRPTIEFYRMPNLAPEKESYIQDYRNNVIQLSTRNAKIKEIVDNSDGKKILILTKQIEHGKLLNDYLKGSEYLHGSLATEVREKIFSDFKSGENNILIMTLSIGSEGIDIPDLNIIINAAANKSNLKSIQVLGRVLRLFEGKTEAKYIDFIDCGKYSRKHSEMRMQIFQEQGHEVKIL